MSGRRKKILLVITDLNVGGAEQALVEIAVRLPELGWSCCVAVLGLAPPPERGRLVGRLRDAGIAPTFLLAKTLRDSPRAVAELGEIVRKTSPQIVQSFLHHANILSAVAARHTNEVRVVTGIRVAERRRNAHRWLARRTDRWVARHVCVSRSVADFAATTTGLPQEKLVVIPNGVDHEMFEQARPVSAGALGVAAGRKFILFVGRLDPQKRVDWLIARMPEIVDRLPSHDLVVVGEGPERGRLESISKRLDLAARVHFVGWRSDIPSVLNAADLLVLTSAWEGMPNIVLEALAAGRPIVATAAEGIAELLGDQSGGQLVGLDDAEGFVNAVAAILNDPQVAAKLAEFNRRRAGSFSWDSVTGQYDALYRRLLAQ